MEAFLLVCILIVLLVRWIVLHNRLEQIDSRIDELYRLVQRPPMATPAILSPMPPPPAREEPVAAPAPPPPVVAPPVLEPTVVAPPPAAPPPAPPAALPSEPPPQPHIEHLPPQPVTRPEPAPAAARVDWEAAVGGNLLNKAGVVLLVIGLALALAYSFAHIGPLGRVAISLAVSLAMLISGVVFEPREKYRMFARGLIGGGWAGLYTTVYAMHAVPEALVIPDAFIGTALLIFVAAGMIAHSLRYRSQTVTGLAYFIAFGTLAIAEANTLAIVALIPLAASLLYIVHRFAWTRTALIGLVATYGVIVIRGDHGAPLWQAQTLFAIFWLLFEAFDVLHPEAWLLPLNAVGFLGLSLLKWNTAAPHDVWMLLSASAAAYLVSTLARWRSGEYPAAATLSAGLAAAAIFQKMGHEWVAPALLIEAELIYLAGVRLRASYLRWLATAIFAVQTGRLLIGDMPTLPLHSWTSVAAVSALVFYANRVLESADLYFGYVAAGLLALVIGNEAPPHYRSLEWLALAAASLAAGGWRRLFDFRAHGYLVGILGLTAVAAEAETNQPALWGALAFTYGLALASRYFLEGERDVARLGGGIMAGLTAMALVWRLAPGDYLGIAWMALALIILELGLLNLPPEFRYYSYAVAAVGALRVWEGNLLFSTAHGTAVAAIATLLAYGLAARALTIRQPVVYAAALSGGTLFLLRTLSLAVAEPWVAPLWALAAFILAVAAETWNEPVMRICGYCVAGLVFLRCWGINVEKHEEAVLAAVFAALCYAGTYFFTPRERPARVAYALAAAALITLLLWYEASGSLLTVSWGIEGTALLGAGFALRERLLRLSGLGLLLACILKLFLWDLRHLDTLPRIFSFIVLGLILVGVSWVYTRFREHVERYL